MVLVRISTAPARPAQPCLGCWAGRALREAPACGPSGWWPAGAPRGAQEGLSPCLWVVAWVGARVALRPAVSAMSPVNRIKDQCKVSVRIPPDSEKSSLIRIEGDPQGVRQAKRELLELASRMVSLAGPRCAPAAGPRPSPT